MTRSIEIADSLRGLGSYPVHWGLPEGRGNSEERVCWVASNIATDQELKRLGFNAAEVRSGKRPRTMSGAEAMAKLQAIAT